MTTGYEHWPALPLAAWSDTYATLHLWLQIVGKVRLAQSPWTNHAWHVTLYVTPTGLTTSAIPCESGSFDIAFDFVAHRLQVRASDGRTGGFALTPQAVAEFYAAVMRELRAIGVQARIHASPNEVPDPIPFARDDVHRSYDAEYANRFWRILVEVDRVLKRFRARFTGKCSPVHLFWGAPDIAVTRFSGRRAPPHPGGVPNLPDRVTRDAYSHEVSSAGFWPGGGPVPQAAFYAYAIPSRPASRPRRSSRSAPRTTRTCASSSCPTTSCVRRPIPTRSCSRSCRARTSRPPSTRTGIARRWSAPKAKRPRVLDAVRHRKRAALC